MNYKQTMKKCTLLLAIGIMIGSFAQAQALKLGYINSQELLSLMPEVTQAEKDLQAFAKTYQDQLEAMAKEYEKKIQEFQVQEKTMTEAVKEVKIKEIQQLQERIESTQQSAQEKVAAKKQEVYKPLLEKADKAIKDVAKEKNYDYIFDASAGMLLFAKDSDDILSFVKAKLGIK
jgi:outer membrane protein